jgi:hypothetical protein
MKHNWVKDEDGNVDEWAWERDFHNGVFCNRCYKMFCVHCNPDYDKDECKEYDNAEKESGNN